MASRGMLLTLGGNFILGRVFMYEEVTVKRILLSTLMALSVSACTVTPKPLTTASLSSFASDKLARVTAQQEPVTDAITLYEAMARALKYNLDFHVELYNEALANKKLDSVRLDGMPELVQNMSITGRNNDSGTKGSTLFSDKKKFTEDVTLSWNILDLGLSKVRAEQAADEVLIASERRRKIINRVIEDVRTAYWRAVSADRLVKGLRRLEGRARRALNNSQALQKDGQTSPLTALTYQRELVEIQQRIQRLQKDLSLAKMQLAALMNIRPGESFTLAQPKRRASSTKIKMTPEEMIFVAMENRTEVRDIQYQLRINAKELKAATLETLPGVNVFASFNIDSDSFLYNNNWLTLGLRSTSNLLNVFKLPAKARLIKGRDEVLDARALAVTMAIITQIHVSKVRYLHSRKLYLTASKHLSVQNGIVRQIRASHAEGQASEQTLIREEMNTLASRVSADIAYADLQNAYANIYASMGLDPYNEVMQLDGSIADVANNIREVWMERGDTSGGGKIHRSIANYKASKAADATVINASGDETTVSSKDPFIAETQGWNRMDLRDSNEARLATRSEPQLFASTARPGDKPRRPFRDREYSN